MSPNDLTPDLTPDDPRVTAWAIGARDALTPEEEAAIAKAVLADADLGASVASLRALDGALASALRGAPVPGFDATQRQAILSGGASRDGARAPRRRVAWLLGATALAAAAGLLVVALSGDKTPAGDGIAKGESATAEAPAGDHPASPPGPIVATGGATVGSTSQPTAPVTTDPTHVAAAPGEGGDPVGATGVASALTQPNEPSADPTDLAKAAGATTTGDGMRYKNNRDASNEVPNANPVAGADPYRAQGRGDTDNHVDRPESEARPSGTEATLGDVGASRYAKADPAQLGPRTSSTREPAAPGALGNELGGARAGELSGDGVGGGGLVGRLGASVGHGYVVTGQPYLDANGEWVYVLPNVVTVPAVPMYSSLDQRRIVYAPRVPWPFRLTAAAPLSTFSIDVDSASLSHARRHLRAGHAVPQHLVRVEEIVNAFHYDDPRPEGEQPIAVKVDVAESPWQPANRLVRVALTARPVEHGDRAPANLVFLVDVSGSMSAKSKLPLLVDALRRLVDGLGEDDRVAIVTYASKAKVVLEPTAASDKDVILKALGKLRAGGYTNGGAGLDVAYDLARRAGSADADRSNSRVILATDGDFNAGRVDNGELQRVIRDKARSGVMLSVLGFGESGYDDQRLEMLAKYGNGRYAFIDSVDEAERVLVRELDATLVTAARDVRIQVELNPAQALGYHLIGYENRAMAAAEFNQEGKDAGELGAGESVVAFYEIMPAPGSRAFPIDALKYQGGGGAEPAPGEGDAVDQELMTVKVRWVPTAGGPSQRLDVPVVDHGERLQSASPDFVFSAAAAAFGMRLQGWSDPSRLVSWSLIRELVDQAGASWSADDDRRQLSTLVDQAARIYGGP